VSAVRWLFGDGDSANGANASHIYPNVGRYLPKLVITHFCGVDTIPIPDSVSIGATPVAAFGISADSLYEPEAVRFTDQSVNNPTQWSWHFGDGGASSQQSPSHVYAAGAYSAGVWVDNPCGTDTATDQTILVGGFRVSDFDSLGHSGDTVRYSYAADTLVIPYDHPIYFSAQLAPEPTRGSVAFEFSTQGVIPPIVGGKMSMTPSPDVPSGSYQITISAIDSLRNATQIAQHQWKRLASPYIEIGPVPLDFGRTLVNSSVVRTLTVFNSAPTGSGISLRLEKPAIIGSMYTISADSITLAPQAFVNWNVTFRPTAFGVLNGAVRIRSNDPAAPDTTIPTTGRGASELIPPQVSGTTPGADQFQCAT
jgi:PKD repeat protein